MDTVQIGDLVAVVPESTDGQFLVASTWIWNEVDELLVEQSERIRFDEIIQARVKSISFGRATAAVYSPANQEGVSAGDEITLRLSTLVDRVPSVTDTSGVSEIRVPGATLGDEVTVLIYQIRDEIAYGTPTKLISQGFSVGDRLPVTVYRMNQTGHLDLTDFNNVLVNLQKPVVVGGNAVVELTGVNGELSGKIVDLDFIPKTGDRFKMDVSNGSSHAVTNWDGIRGVKSIQLRHESIASGEAVVKLTELGQSIEGEITEYTESFATGERISAVVTKGQREAQALSPEAQLLLDEPADLSGKAVVEIHQEAKIDSGIHPACARLISYDSLPSEGEIVNAKLTNDNHLAHTYTGEHPIELLQNTADTGFAKVEIVSVDQAELQGQVVQVGMNESQDDQEKKIKNPFTGVSTSRNKDITGRKL